MFHESIKLRTAFFVQMVNSIKSEQAVGIMLRMRIARRFRRGLLKNRSQAELVFESYLEEFHVKYMRQAIFIDFPKFYIVDFYIQAPKRIVVEIDGPHHQERRKRRLKDLHQNAYFECSQTQLVRFSNDEILNHPDAVKKRLLDILSHRV